MQEVPLGLADLILFLFLVPVAIGVSVDLVAGKTVPVVARIAITLVAFCMSGIFTIIAADDCSMAYYLHLEAPGLLAPKELKTLHSTQLICPVSYTFTRDGEKACLANLAGEVSVGCG